MEKNRLASKGLGILSIALALCFAATADAQRSHGGWGGGHGGGGGGGDRGSYGSDRGSSRSSSSTRSTTRYGTNHNVERSIEPSRLNVTHLPPLKQYDPHGWEWNHHDLYHDGYRWGYYHYDRWWRDDSFLFGFYLFSPVGPWVYSPWYYYPCLPPYIAEDRVVVVHDAPQSWNWGGDGWGDYDWVPPTHAGGDYTDLDYALQDLTIGFEDRNLEAAGRLMPLNGRVEVYNEGHYSYSLSATDFTDTFKDGITGPRTSRYHILKVKTNGHDVANVLAEQTYTDPWGKTVNVFHTYRLNQEGSNVVIRSFGTYRDRPPF